MGAVTAAPADAVEVSISTVDGVAAVVHDLSTAPDVATVQDVVRRAARRLVGADGGVLVLREDGACRYVDEDAIAPLGKGRVVPLADSVCGWAILHRTPAVVPDVEVDPRIPAGAYAGTFVRSLVVLPVRAADPVGAIGAYWATPHAATGEEVRRLQRLADVAAVALVQAQLREALDEMAANRAAEIRRISQVDELTGVLNRRGFLEAARSARAHLRRNRTVGHVLFADVDGLKRTNDTHGHEAGDALIRDAARAMRETLREVDVVGRWGGDELVAFAHESEDGEALARRVRLAAAAYGVTLSLGLARLDRDDDRTIEQLLDAADHAMYEGRQRRRVVEPDLVDHRLGRTA